VVWFEDGYIFMYHFSVCVYGVVDIVLLDHVPFLPLQVYGGFSKCLFAWTNSCLAVMTVVQTFHHHLSIRSRVDRESAGIAAQRGTSKHFCACVWSDTVLVPHQLELIEI